VLPACRPLLPSSQIAAVSCPAAARKSRRLSALPARLAWSGCLTTDAGAALCPTGIVSRQQQTGETTVEAVLPGWTCGDGWLVEMVMSLFC